MDKGEIREAVETILEQAPTPLDRMLRAYAFRAALNADDTGEEFGNLIGKMKEVVEGEIPPELKKLWDEEDSE